MDGRIRPPGTTGGRGARCGRTGRVEKRGVAQTLLHQAQRGHAVVEAGVERAHEVDEVHLRAGGQPRRAYPTLARPLAAENPKAAAARAPTACSGSPVARLLPGKRRTGKARSSDVQGP
jgi:superfamily II DNA/RNA helicase